MYVNVKWDQQIAFNEALKQAKDDGYRYRVFAYRTVNGWNWTYRVAMKPQAVLVDRPEKWRQD